MRRNDETGEGEIGENSTREEKELFKETCQKRRVTRYQNKCREDGSWEEAIDLATEISLDER